MVTLRYLLGLPAALLASASEVLGRPCGETDIAADGEETKSLVQLLLEITPGSAYRYPARLARFEDGLNRRGDLRPVNVAGYTE